MAHPPSEDLARGQRLGRFEILRRLDAGGMGEVYAARSQAQEGFVKLVAIKVLLPGDSLDRPEQQLWDEARVMGSLHHPNIAQVYEAGRVDGRAFFAMEYVHGQSLSHTLARLAQRGRGLSLENALWIVKSVAAALHYAHDKRSPDGRPALIVHRDVCPANIMLTYDGTAKLIDFGVAKAATTTPKTAPGTIKGNLRYMSPEQLIGTALDRRSDVFSLGIVLFELTTGTRFIRERDDQRAAQVVLNGKLPRPSERRSGYSPALESIVMTALARSPDSRYPDARALQQAIEEFARDEQLVLSDIELSQTMQQLFGDSAELSTQRDLLATLGLPEGAPPAALATAVAPLHAIGTGTLPMSQEPAPTAPGGTLPMAQAPVPAPEQPGHRQQLAEPVVQSGRTQPLGPLDAAPRMSLQDESAPLRQRRDIMRRAVWVVLACAIGLLLAVLVTSRV